MRIEISSINTLTEMHRVGHTCTGLDGELLVIWGGINRKAAQLTSPNAHLWIYETLTGHCRRINCTGECPPHLSGTTSCLIGQKMYIFGGYSTVFNEWINGLYCLDLDTLIWQNLGSNAKAEPAKPIRSDKYASWSHKGRLYIFGGYGWSQVEHLPQLLDKQQGLQITPDERCPKYGWNNQLVEFNPEDSTWRWPTYSGKAPSPRGAHSGAMIDSRYYIFGGRSGQGRLNDLHVLDMDTLNWKTVATFSINGTLIRSIKNLTTSENNPQHQSRQPSIEDEANICANQEVNVSESLVTLNKPTIPPSRSFCSFTPINDMEILLYGGVSSRNTNLDDCWLLNIRYNYWRKLTLNDKLPRLWHTATYTKDKEVVIIGGSSSENPEEFCPDVITISLEPKSLKRLALDTVSSSIKLKEISNVEGLPLNITKLIKLRKKGMLQSLKGFSKS